MSELYVYYTVLYRKISGLRRRYNTYSTNVTYKTRAPLRGSVSYRPKSDSDPALDTSETHLHLSNSLLDCRILPSPVFWLLQFNIYIDTSPIHSLGSRLSPRHSLSFLFGIFKLRTTIRSTLVLIFPQSFSIIRTEGKHVLHYSLHIDSLLTV